MTVKLDLKPEVEAGLMAQAHARGLSLEAWLDRVLQSAVYSTQAQAVEHARNPAGPHTSRKSLVQLFAESPFKGLDMIFERDPDTGRPVPL